MMSIRNDATSNAQNGILRSTAFAAAAAPICPAIMYALTPSSHPMASDSTNDQ
jgi:hypothetical protein